MKPPTPTEALDQATRTLLPPGPLLVACSGGADSVALLHAAVAAGHWQVTAAFVDHGWGPHTEAAAAVVRAAATRLGIEVVWLRAAGGPGEGLEDQARRARLAALEQVSAGRPVALAHTREDQLETFAMRWAAGAGLRGLAGMPERRGCFRRPWLRVPRTAVREWLSAQAIPWAEDPTNADDRFLRNRVRHQLLPALDAVFGPGWRGAGSASVEHLRSAESWVASVTRDLDEKEWSAEALRALDPFLRHRVAGGWGGGRRQRTTTATVEALVARPPGTAVVPLAGGQALERAYGRVLVARGPLAGGPPVAIEGPGEVQWGSLRVVVGLAVGRPDETRICQAAAPFPWAVRQPEPGDRMRPLGAPGAKPLNRLFIDARVPRSERSGPVVCDGQGPIYVRGLRIAERVRVADGPAWAIHLEVVESSR